MTIRKLSLMITFVAAMLAVLVWCYPTNSDFKSENPSWNGARDFLDDFRVLPLSSLDALSVAPQESTLLIIPYMEFTTTDLKTLENYVSSGGKLVVLDDYGFGNDILEHLKIETRFTGNQLLDTLSNYKNENFPKIVNFVSEPAASEIEKLVFNYATILEGAPQDNIIAWSSYSSFVSEPATSGIKNLVFNHATSLENVSQDNIIAWSSYFSFLDENQNGEYDEGEPEGPFPVIAHFQIGKGELVLVSDPSILINSMLGMGDNRRFLENIAQGQIFLDQSHLPEASLDEAKGKLKIARNVLATVWGTLALIVLALVLTLKPIWNMRKLKQRE